MAAPFRRWLLRRMPMLLSRFAPNKGVSGTKTAYRLDLPHPPPASNGKRRSAGVFPLNFAHALLWTGCRNLRARLRANVATKGRELCTGGGGEGSGGHEDDAKRRLKLMDFNELIWPHPLKSLRNALFTFLIKGYFEDGFGTGNFLNGAEQAVQCVSNLISQGDFDQLDGLVTREAQRELRRNYEKLSLQQRQFIAVNPQDIFFRFIYEIGMIIDDQTNERFVEITAVFQGVHGLDDMKSRNPDTFAEEMQNAHDQVYVCNYRFIREYTKGKDDSWIINKLNHFKAKELAEGTSILRR